jgi:hypothetical protein
VGSSTILPPGGPTAPSAPEVAAPDVPQEQPTEVKPEETSSSPEGLGNSSDRAMAAVGAALVALGAVWFLWQLGARARRDL